MDAFTARLREPRFGMVFVSAVLSLLMAAHWPPMLLPGLVVLGIALVRPHVVVRPIVWWVMAGLWLTAVILVQDRMEDHVPLFAVWLVALAISLAADTEDSFIDRAAWHARVLVGVTFAAAVSWKLYFGDYVAGTTLWVFMLVDRRFEPLATMVGLSETDLERDREGMTALLEGTVSTVSLDAPGTVMWRITAAAVITLVLEAVIAISHLVPDSSRLVAVRLPSVVLFGVLTYSVVPVIPFAALLGMLTMVVARWRSEVMWVFPLMILVSVGRLSIRRLT
jgi:hypothetical protein